MFLDRVAEHIEVLTSLVSDVFDRREPVALADVAGVALAADVLEDSRDYLGRRSRPLRNRIDPRPDLVDRVAHGLAVT